MEALFDLITSGAASVALRAAHRHRTTVLNALDIRQDWEPTADTTTE